MRIHVLIAAILAATVSTASAANLSKIKEWTGGEPPPLALEDLDGQQRELSHYRGKVVVLNFWATWCAPCIEEMPAFERLAAQLADEPFALVTVNFGEKPSRITPFLKKIDVDIPVLLDTKMKVSKAWVKRGLPTTFIIDGDQSIRYQVLGEIEWDAPEVVAKIRELLPAP